MKKLTHPFSVKTLIIARNGAIYNKKWVYFRGSLPLEQRISSPIFLNKQNSKSRYEIFFSFLKGRKLKNLGCESVQSKGLYRKDSVELLNFLTDKELLERKKFPHISYLKF